MTWRSCGGRAAVGRITAGSACVRGLGATDCTFGVSFGAGYLGSMAGQDPQVGSVAPANEATDDGSGGQQEGEGRHWGEPSRHSVASLRLSGLPPLQASMGV